MENSDPDSTLRQFQILQETQSQIEILNSQIAKINKHISNQKIKAKRTEVALESLNSVTEDRDVYKQVSRLLILRDKEELKAEVAKEQESTKLDLPKLEGIRNQLVAKLGGLNTQLLEVNKQIRLSQRAS